jgi:hypothetical protein
MKKFASSWGLVIKFLQEVLKTIDQEFLLDSMKLALVLHSGYLTPAVVCKIDLQNYPSTN